MIIRKVKHFVREKYQQSVRQGKIIMGVPVKKKKSKSRYSKDTPPLERCSDAIRRSRDILRGMHEYLDNHQIAGSTAYSIKSRLADLIEEAEDIQKMMSDIITNKRELRQAAEDEAYEDEDDETE